MQESDPAGGNSGAGQGAPNPDAPAAASAAASTPPGTAPAPAAAEQPGPMPGPMPGAAPGPMPGPLPGTAPGPYPYDPYRPYAPPAGGYDPYGVYGLPPQGPPGGPPLGQPAFGAWPPPPPMRPEAGPVGPVGPLDEGARRRRIRTMVIAGVGAVIIGVGGFFAIDAAVHHSQRVAAPGPVTRRPTGGGFGAGFRRGGTAGTISAINGTNLTLTTPAGATVKVVASSTTPVTKTAPGSVSSIAQGDTVTVIGTSSGTSIDASRILDAGTGTLAAVPALPGFGRVGPAGFGVTSGKVTGIDGGTLIVTEPGGTTATVTTSSSTTVTTQQQLSVSALTTGETIRVAGTTNSDGSITATAIQEGGPGGFRGGPPVGPPA